MLERAQEADQAKRFRRASQLVDVALNLNPTSELATMLHLTGARASAHAGAWTCAERHCRRILEHTPSVEAHGLLARCLLEQSDAGGAIREIEAGLGLGTDDPVDRTTYTRALSAAGRHEDAIRMAEEARDGARDIATLKLLVHVLAAAGAHHRVIEVIGSCSADNDADLWTTLGFSLNALGRSDQAAEAFRRALIQQPDRSDAGCSLGMALLRLGELEEGFRYNEHRQPQAGGSWRLGIRPWRGEPLEGTHLMVLPEQGLGDTIQFARFVPLVRRLAARVTFHAPRPLIRLLRSAPDIGDVEAGHPGFESADYQTLLMSLPYLLRVAASAPCTGSAHEVPWSLPAPLALRAAAADVERWRARLPPGPKIALAWQGNPRFGGEPWRSMPFDRFAPIVQAHANDIAFLSLQKHHGREQLSGSPWADRVIDLADVIDGEGDAFVDSLAILSLVDLFLTTDTALAHVAGSAGVRTWVLLSHVADWRWGVDRKDTPYYPSIRLFRQTTGGDWDGVIRQVAEDLSGVFQSARQSGSKSAAECPMPPQVVGTDAWSTSEGT